MKTNVSDCLHVIPEQLTHSTKSVQNHASMQVNCLEFWVQKIWKNEFLISLYFAQCRYHRNTKNDITPLNQIHKTVCDSDIFHLSHYLWSGSTLGIRIHFRGKNHTLEKYFLSPGKTLGIGVPQNGREKKSSWHDKPAWMYLVLCRKKEEEGRRGGQLDHEWRQGNYMWWALPEGRQAEKAELPVWTWFLVGIVTTLGSPWLPALSSKCFLQISSEDHTTQVWKCWGILENMKK